MAGVSETIEAAGRRLDVQGLRAVAVLLVVVYHARPDLLPGGFVGVDVFFVISGFVITLLLQRELESTGRIDLRGFYARRVRRILPALAVMLVAVAVASVFIMGPLRGARETAVTGVAASTIWANVQLYLDPAGYFDLPAESNALLHTWSLSVEEQFYLLFPLLVIAAYRLRRVALTLGVVAAGSFALSLSTTGPFAFYMTPARAWEFISGALVALSIPAFRRIPDLVALVLGSAGFGLIIFAAFSFSGHTPFPGTAALLPVGGTVLLLAAGTGSQRWAAAVLATRPLTRIGDLSYGWYLWHWPAIVFTRIVAREWTTVAAFGTLGLAWASHRLIEAPVRYNPRLVGRRVAGLAAGCVMVPALMATAVPRFAELLQSDGEREREAAISPWHADVMLGCDSWSRIADRPEECTWRVPNSAGTIVLVGDSNAGHFTEAVVEAGNQLGFDVLVATRSACPFVLKVESPECDDYVSRALVELVELRPSLLFVSSSGGTLRPPLETTWETGLIDVLGRLTSAGIPTVSIHQVPHLPGWDPSSCGNGDPSQPTSCDHHISADPASTGREAIRRVELAARDAVPEAVWLDLDGEICPDHCDTDRDGLWAWRDGAHLSVDGAMTLVPRFTEVIREVLMVENTQ